MNKKQNNYASSTLNSILDIKEKRFLYKNKLIKKYKKPLLIFTMNIPKELKNNNLINFNFNFFANKIIESMQKITIYKKIEYSNYGNILYIVFDANPIKIKELFTKFDDSFPLGRLLDIDVYNENNSKISRNNLRKCFICKKIAFECSRNDTHSTYEIVTYIEKLLYDNYKYVITSELTKSYYNEIYSTPKPGLVDLNNNGSHKDLNIELFEKSIKTISTHFDKIIDITKKYITNYYIKNSTSTNNTNNYSFIIYNNYIVINNKSKKSNTFLLQNKLLNFNKNFYDDLFLKLKKYGCKIEQDMFKATLNINTHKGALYFSILLLSTFTLLIYENEMYSNNNLWQNLISHIKYLVKTNYFDAIKKSIASPNSYGEIIYKTYNTFGPREEAYKGLPNIYKSLKYYIKLNDLYYKLCPNNNLFEISNNISHKKNKMIANFIKTNNHFIDKKYLKIYDKYYTIIEKSKQLSIINYKNFVNLFILNPNLIIYISSILKDTNILHRGKIEGLKYVQNNSFNLLKNKNIINTSPIYNLDKKFIIKNLSPGGAADILNVTIFLYNIMPYYKTT